MARLVDYGFNEYSQHGEDGMIERVLGWLGMKSGSCVEFGAWDGYRFSNTARLWTRQWRAWLLECDLDRCKDLSRNTAPFENVAAMHAMVTLEEGHRWTDFVGETPDIVSIDVDGNDYWIFKESPAGPSLYVVEHNTSVPAWMDLYTPYAPDNNFGCSLAALVRLAKEKGYAYIGSTKSNGFFLRLDLMPKIPDLECDLRDAGNQGELVYLMSSYAGEFKETKLGPYGRTQYYEKPILNGNDKMKAV